MNITQVLNQEKCCGCSACVATCPQNCISMEKDEQGFLRPKIAINSCIDCGKCEKKCPALHIKETRIPLKVWAAKNRDEKVRLSSSSGGVFMALAKVIIERGGVVFGAKFDDDWGVVHDYAETMENVIAFSGSKYLQSRMEDCFVKAKKFLDEERWVLFTGTQCQIKGLKCFLGHDYQRLLTVDIICHGAPSPMVWDDYLLYIRQQQINGYNTNHVIKELPIIEGIFFRDKSMSWKESGLVFHFRKSEKKTNKNTCSSKTDGKDECWSTYNKLYNDLFFRGFLRNLFLRPSCYDCPAKNGLSQSDMTIGDYWGLPETLKNWDDDRGISIVLVYTEKGSSILEELNIEKIETTYENGLKANQSIAFSVTKPRLTTYFWKKYPEKKIKTIEICLNKMQPSIIYRAIRKIYRTIKGISR